MANANPSGRWTADHKGIGITDVIVTMVYDEEKNNTFPDFFFEFRGAPCYDWRRDSTVGGSGPHRWADKSTHEFTENPIVIEYNYRRGFSIGDDVFCGMQMLEADLPVDRWTAAAALCDETVAGGESRYRVSILLDCMATHGDNIEALMLSCGGMTIDAVDGSWPLVGSDQTALAIITDDDLVAGAPVKYRAKRSMGELVNAVSGTSPDPELLWSMTDYATQTSGGLVSVDRRGRDVPIDFPQVPSKRQAGQLAGIYLEENRWEATAEIMVRPRYQTLKPGDWIRWNSVRYGDKTYLVTESTLSSLDSDGPRNNQLSLQERDGSIYDGVIAPPIILPWPPGRPQYATEAQDFGVVAISLEGVSGDMRPGFRASWLPFDDLTVTHVEIQYWPSDQPAAVFKHPPVPRDETIAIIAAGVTSRTKFKFRSRIITSPRRQVAWSAPIEVESTDAPTRDIVVELRTLQREIRDDLQRRETEFDRTFDDLRKVVANILTRDSKDVVDSQTFEKRIGNNSAKISQERILRLTDKEAFTEQMLVLTGRLQDAESGIVGLGHAIQGVNTQVTNIDGRITSLSTALTAIGSRIDGVDGQILGQAGAINQLTTKVTKNGNDVTAVSTALTTVEAMARDASANGLIRWVAEAGDNLPAGASARFSIEGKASKTGAYKFAGAWLDIYPSRSEWLFKSDLFKISDGSAKGTPFVFENSELKAAVVRIGTVYFDQLLSNNKKLSVKGFGTNASIEILG